MEIKFLRKNLTPYPFLMRTGSAIQSARALNPEFLGLNSYSVLILELLLEVRG